MGGFGTCSPSGTGSPSSEVTVCAGADAVVGYACLATLDPGDEAVTGWPSFASYVIDPLKLGAIPVRVPLDDERIDLDALLAAITPSDEARLHRRAEQPDRYDQYARRARFLLRARASARPDGARSGVLRVPQRAGLPRGRRGVRRYRTSRARAAGPSRRSSASRASGSATASALRTSSRLSARCVAHST